MIPFRERNPVKVGAVSLMVIALLLVMSFKADSLPVIGGGTTYTAQFTEAGGLQPGDDVRVAGVRVGQVDSIELAGDHVDVDFKIREKASFGPQSRAAIKVRTLLGSMYLELTPIGSGQMAAESTIPTSRTTSPYSVVDAFTGLADTAGAIDSDQLAGALTTLADLTRNTPESFRGALGGLSRLSRQLAAKDERIDRLLKNLDRVTTTLDARDQDIVKLMRDASTLFDALVKRRQAIHNLLTSTQTLAKSLSDLVDASRADLKPMLRDINNVVKVFNQNQESLDSTLHLLAPFYRVFTNTLGNGPWFDVYIQNLPDFALPKGGN